MDNYTFVCKNNAANSRHGGVGLLYKNDLPLLVREDLGFDETLVVELKFGRKKIFFTVLYRSPSHKNGSAEFENCLTKFEDLFQKMKIPTRCFLQVTSMVTVNYGGLAVIRLQKVPG